MVCKIIYLESAGSNIFGVQGNLFVQDNLFMTFNVFDPQVHLSEIGKRNCLLCL